VVVHRYFLYYVPPLEFYSQCHQMLVVGLKAVSTRQAIQQEVCGLELDAKDFVQLRVGPLRLQMGMRVVQDYHPTCPQFQVGKYNKELWFLLNDYPFILVPVLSMSQPGVGPQDRLASIFCGLYFHFKPVLYKLRFLSRCSKTPTTGWTNHCQ
jgi:hypothetical protein